MIARRGLFALLVWLFASSASAQAPTVTVDASCGEVVVGFDAALRVELIDRARELADGLSRHAFTLTLECGDTSAVTVRVVDRATERFVGQRVDRVDRGFVRQLAIVAAELLAALANQLDAVPLHAAVVAGGPPQHEAPPDGFAFGLRATGGVVATATPLVALPYGALGVDFVLADAARLVADLGVGHTRLGTARGDIQTTTLSLAVSLRLGAYLGAVWLGIGPLLRGGAAIFTGQPSGPGITGSQATLPWLGVGAVASMGVAIEGTPLSIELDLEGGGLPLTARALVDGVVQFDLGPAWFGAQLGLALHWPATKAARPLRP